MPLLSALLQYSSQFPGRAFTWTCESTPPQHLFYCVHYQPATNLALSLKERLQRHSLANSHDNLRPSTSHCSSFLPACRQDPEAAWDMKMWKQQDLLEYECWCPIWNKYYTCMNFIHLAGLMQVQMPTWFNDNLEKSSKNLLGIWMLIPKLPGTAGNNQRGLNACRAKHPFPNSSVLARIGLEHPSPIVSLTLKAANTAASLYESKCKLTE